MASNAGSELTVTWLTDQLHCLKHQGPGPVLAELRLLQAAHPDVQVLREDLSYLAKREAHRRRAGLSGRA